MTRTLSLAHRGDGDTLLPIVRSLNLLGGTVLDEIINEQRRVRDKQRKLEEIIKKEILKHKSDQTFLPDEYRKWRLSGKSEKELARDYDLCHIWR